MGRFFYEGHNIYHAYLPLIHLQIVSLKLLTANVFASEFSFEAEDYALMVLIFK